MAGGVGNLTVGLGLDYAQYTAGLTKAQAQAQQFSTNFKASFGGNLAAGFTRDIIQGLAQIPARLVNVVKGSIDAADHLNDLSKSTGVAVETLGGIGFAASQAGSSLEGAADAIGKLNQTLAKAASGNQEAKEALKALGVDALDPLTGKTLDVDKALVKIATTLEKAADSPEKFRAAAAALGKQYRELVPLLQDGGTALLQNIAYYQRFGGITTETAQKADAFNDTLGQINLLTGAFSRTLASELLTPLQGIASAFLSAKEKGDGFKGAAVAIKDALVGIATTASFVVNSLEAIGASVSGIVQKAGILSDLRAKATAKNPLDIFGSGAFTFSKETRDTITAQFDAVDADTAKRRAKAQADFDAFSKNLRDGADLPSPAKKGGRIAGIPDAAAINAAAAAAEAALKKNLDDLLKTITLETNQQQNALAFSERFLEGEYQDKLIGLGNFFDDQSNIRKRALQVQLDEQDRIIAAEQAFLAKTKSPTGRIEATDRIKDAQTRKTGLQVQFGQDEQLALQQRAREAKALEDAFAGVNAQVLDLHENFAAAAAVKFDLQFDALSRTFTANGNAAGQEAIKTMREATIAQAKFLEVTTVSARAQEALQRAEDRIAIQVQTGALTSIEALAKEGEARRALIPLMEAQVAAAKAVADANPDNKNLASQADAALLALQKLKAAADPLADSLNKTFGGDFNTALDDFVTGTKNAADAFHSFAKSVLNDILKMGSKSITESLFGGSGGIGGFLSGLFSQQGGGGLVPSLAFGGGFGGGFNQNAGNVQGIGGRYNGTEDSVGILTKFASLFSGFFADGGVMRPGQWGVVGENGPELAFGGRNGQTIQPAMGGSTQHINVTVQGAPNQSRDSALQQGAAIGSGIQRAMARNN